MISKYLHKLEYLHKFEDLHKLSEAAKFYPYPISTNSIWRHCRKGIKSRSGEKIYLDHVRVGGTIFTTEAAIQEFFRAVAQADREYFQNPERPARPRNTSDSVRDRQIAEASASLAKDGI